MTLNEQQARAVGTLVGPVLITAGAGTGKTRVLTERFLNAVRGSAAFPPAAVDEIVAITFTEKAAGELAERARAALRNAGLLEEARAVDRAWISTIHGLCARLLRMYALDLGLDPEFAVADTVVAGSLRQRAFEEAAEASLGEDGGERLLGEYGFAAVYDTVSSIADALRIARLSSDSLAVEPARPASRLSDDALAVLSEGKAGLEGCGATGQRVSAHLTACEQAIERLRAIPVAELDEAALAEELWRTLDAYSGGRSSTKASCDILEPLLRDLERLGREAAAAAAAPMAVALVGLVRRYVERYDAMKREADLLDFEDLQLELLRLLELPEHAEAIRRRIRLMMVDEFQDTDRLQLEIVERLAPDALCTVGDERQSIYGFRGADVAVYVEHAQDMRRRGAEPIELGVNYRSFPDVLGFINGLFGADELFGERLVRLEAGREEPSPLLPPGEPRVEVVLAHRQGTEEAGPRRIIAEQLADRFAILRDEHGVPAHDMVVLVRTYTHASDYADALRARGFSPIVIGGSRFLGLPETAMLTALCRVIANPLDNEAFGRVLLSDLAQVGDDALWHVSRQAETPPERSLWAAARLCPALGEPDRRALARLVAAVERARRDLGRLPLSTLLLRAVEDCGLDLHMLADGEGGCDTYANILKFARLADDFERQGGAGPAGFVAHLAAQEEFGEQQTPATLADDESPAVRIMSIHAAKGLEFPVVAVPELDFSAGADGAICRFDVDAHSLEIALKLPSLWRSGSTFGNAAKLDRTPLFETLRAGEEAEEHEEAQRLFYVAATRAQEFLLLGGRRNITKPDEGDGLFSQLSRRLGVSGPQDEGVRRLALDDGHGRAVSVNFSVVAAGEAEEVGGASEASQAAPCGEAAERAPSELPPPSTSARTAPPSVPSRLSYSGIAAYGLCGFRYFARSVLKVGELRAASSAIGLGSAVHAALQLAEHGAPDSERLAAIATYHQLDAAGAGRLTDAVEAYVRSPLAREVAEMSSTRREAPFGVRLESAAGAFLLDGSLDVYAVDGVRALIVDYKSGASGAAHELRERYRLQAECYALAALRDGRREVRVVFVRPQVREADGSLQQVSYDFGPADEAAIVGRIAKVHERMAAGEYPHMHEWDDQLCGDCPVAFGLCPLRPTGAAASA